MSDGLVIVYPYAHDAHEVEWYRQRVIQRLRAEGHPDPESYVREASTGIAQAVESALARAQGRKIPLEYLERIGQTTQ